MVNEMLDFRSLLIGEIAMGFSHKAQVMSNHQLYFLVSEGCKKIKVEPPTKEEWDDYMKFIEWHGKILQGLMENKQ